MQSITDLAQTECPSRLQNGRPNQLIVEHDYHCACRLVLLVRRARACGDARAGQRIDEDGATTTLSIVKKEAVETVIPSTVEALCALAYTVYGVKLL